MENLAQKINALENDIEGMGKNEELEIVKTDMQKNIGEVFENLNIIENNLNTIERNVLQEINFSDHKIAAIEVKMKKDIDDMKNSIQQEQKIHTDSTSSDLRRLKSSISDKELLD